MEGKTCCIIGNRELTEKEIKKANNYLLTVFENLIVNNCNHFIVGATTEADILAAKIIASLKDKNSDIILELAVQNEAMICFAPNEIKSLFFENKIDLVHIEKKEHNDSEEKECYKCMIDLSDIVVAVCNENIDNDIHKKLIYAKAKNKDSITIIV